MRDLMIGISVFALVLWWRRPHVVVPTGDAHDPDPFEAGSTNYSDSIQNFARAIAYAEGYGIPGAIPTVANNPGDLVLPGWSPTMGSAGIAVFDSADYGWSRLYRQLALIVGGQSDYYRLNMTIAEMGRTYAGGDENWSRNVASYLGVSPSTSLRQVLA